MGKKLKYSLANEEVNYLLQVLDRVQTRGIQASQSLLAMVEKLKNPENAAELEKEQLVRLQKKYSKDGEKSTEKK